MKKTTEDKRNKSKIGKPAAKIAAKPAAKPRRRGRPIKPDGRSAARRVAGLATSSRQLAAIDRLARRNKTTRPEALQLIIAAGIKATG